MLYELRPAARSDYFELTGEMRALLTATGVDVDDARSERGCSRGAFQRRSLAEPETVRSSLPERPRVHPAPSGGRFRYVPVLWPARLPWVRPSGDLHFNPKTSHYRSNQKPPNLQQKRHFYRLPMAIDRLVIVSYPPLTGRPA